MSNKSQFLLRKFYFCSKTSRELFLLILKWHLKLSLSQGNVPQQAPSPFTQQRPHRSRTGPAYAVQEAPTTNSLFNLAWSRRKGLVFKTNKLCSHMQRKRWEGYHLLIPIYTWIVSYFLSIQRGRDWCLFQQNIRLIFWHQHQNTTNTCIHVGDCQSSATAWYKGERKEMLLLLYWLFFVMFLLELKPFHCLSYTTRKVWGVCETICTATDLSNNWPTTDERFQVSGPGSFGIIYKSSKQTLNFQNTFTISKTRVVF